MNPSTFQLPQNRQFLFVFMGRILTHATQQDHTMNTGSDHLLEVNRCSFQVHRVVRPILRRQRRIDAMPFHIHLVYCHSA